MEIVVLIIIFFFIENRSDMTIFISGGLVLLKS